MATWTITYSDDSTDSVTADDLASASAAMPPVPGGLQFVSLVLDPAPTPTALGIVASPDGKQWAITVDNDGKPIAVPANT